MKNILIAIDFTDHTNEIINYGINISETFKTGIILFHAYQVPIAYSDIPVVTLSLEEIKNNCIERLHRIKKEIENKTNNTVSVTIELKLGEPANELENTSRILNPLYIIMGAGSSTKLERAFIGSTTLHCINTISNPVLVIPNQAKYKKFQNIGFASDFSKNSNDSSLNVIASLATLYNASLHIIHVSLPKEEETYKKEKEYLGIKFKNLRIAFHEIIDENIEHGIHQFTKNNGIDILITIPRKHNLIEKIFNKMHRSDLIFHSDIPILCIHE